MLVFMYINHEPWSKLTEDLTVFIVKSNLKKHQLHHDRDAAHTPDTWLPRVSAVCIAILYRQSTGLEARLTLED